MNPRRLLSMTSSGPAARAAWRLALAFALVAFAVPASLPALAQYEDEEDQQAGDGTAYTPYDEADERDAAPPRSSTRAPASERRAYAYEYNDDPDRPSEYFARVRSIDGDPQVVRRDGVAEDLQRNSPVYTGERIETGPTGRIELQLPGGELVRIEAGSVVDLYALGENPRREEEGTLVGLSQGSLQADVPAGGEIRIDTPTASVYPNSRAALRVDIGTGNMVRISVERGTVEVAGEGGSVTLRSGERTRVYAGGPPRKPAPYNLMVRDSFGSWVASRDDLYELRAAPGREYEELPEEVRPYYGELSRNGSWVYTDEYGWAWKPGSVDDDWRPYVDGSWSYGPYGPVWVGAEPWGWPVYRYGRWDWSVRVGAWLWIPGYVFRPAHVYWYWGPSYVGWCPLGYWDTPVYFSAGWYWGDPWFNGYPWTFVNYNYFYGYPVPRHTVPRGKVVPHDLRAGVVGRDANGILTGSRGVVRTVRRGDVTVREVSPDAYRVARDRAGDRTAARRAGLRPVPEVGGQSATGSQQGTPGRAGATARRSSFIDHERQVVGDRTTVRGRSGAPASGSPGSTVRRGSAPGPGAAAPGSPAPSGSGGGGRGNVRPRAEASGGAPVARIRPGEPTAVEQQAQAQRAPLVTNQPGAAAASPGTSRRPVIRIRPVPDEQTPAKATPSGQQGAEKGTENGTKKGADQGEGARREAAPETRRDPAFQGFGEPPVREVRPAPEGEEGKSENGGGPSAYRRPVERREIAPASSERRLRTFPREAPSAGARGRSQQTDRGAVREFFGRIAEEDRPASRGPATESSPRAFRDGRRASPSGGETPRRPAIERGDSSASPPPPAREAPDSSTRSGDSVRSSSPPPPPSAASSRRSAPSGGNGGGRRGGGGGGKRR